jgi:hypothetical protein
MSKQYLFRIGERVELVSCPGFPGTVTGFASTKIRVKSMTSEMNLLGRSGRRACSSQKSRSLVDNVPKSVRSGTRILFSGRREE